MKNLRNYKGKDSKMLEKARIIYHQFILDSNYFINYSTKFNENYANNFLNKIEAAENLKTNNELLSQQVVKTKHLIKLMDEAKRLYVKTKSYAQLTFEGDQSIIMREFSNGYLKSRNSIPKMIQFLEVLIETIQRHQIHLSNPLKGGMPAQFISDIIDIKESLKNTNLEKETFVVIKKTQTVYRKTTLNECYKIMMEVNKFAQIVFEGSPVKQNIYRYK